MSTQPAQPRTPFSDAPITRRQMLLGAAGALVLGACGGSDEPETTGPAPVDESLISSDDTIAFMQPIFSDGFRAPATLVAGIAQRAPIELKDGTGLSVVNGLPDALDLTLTLPDGSTQEVEAPLRAEGLAVPIFPLTFTPEMTGEYLVNATIDGNDLGFQFIVVDREQVPLVFPGDQMLPFDTATFDDPRGFNPVCTRFDPCPFHEVSLTDAMAAPGPTALLISTPAFCQTAVCGPVLEMLMDQAAEFPDITMVHAEVYTDNINEVADFSTLLSPIMELYGLNFEPSLVVADTNNVVTSRLDFTYDANELRSALQAAS